MKPTFHTDTLYPAKMSNTDKNHLTDRLFTIHKEIFEGVSKEQFRKYVIEPDSRLTRIRVYKDREGNEVGYLSFQVFETGKRRRDPLVVRTEVGFLPNFRRYNITLPTLIKDAVKYQLSTLGRKAYFLATPVHPTPYRLGLAQLPEVWPRPDQPTPESIQAVFNQLTNALKIQKSETGSRFTCKVGWKVKESQVLKDRIMSRKDPVTRFYLEHNPDYTEGNGLLMLVPLTFQTYFKGFQGLARKKDPSVHESDQKPGFCFQTGADLKPDVSLTPEYHREHKS